MIDDFANNNNVQHSNTEEMVKFTGQAHCRVRSTAIIDKSVVGKENARHSNDRIITLSSYGVSQWMVALMET